MDILGVSIMKYFKVILLYFATLYTITLLCFIYSKLQPETRSGPRMFCLVNNVLSEHTLAHSFTVVYGCLCDKGMVEWFLWTPYLPCSQSCVREPVASAASHSGSTHRRASIWGLILYNHSLKILKSFIFELVFCGACWSLREEQVVTFPPRLMTPEWIWQRTTRQGFLTHPHTPIHRHPHFHQQQLGQRASG